CSFVPGAAASPNNPAYRLGARLLLWPVAKLVANSAAKEGFPQTARESASSLKPSRNDCLGLRRTVKENGGGPLQTSALPLGYGAATRKLASYFDFLKPPWEVLPTSSKPRSCRTGRVKNGRDCWPS